MTIFSAAMSIYNIKRLQLDQHRAWILRCMLYMGTIITMRFIILSGTAIIGQIGGYSDIWPCDRLVWTYQRFGIGNALATKYPQCFSSSNSTLANNNNEVLVSATTDPTAPESAYAAVDIVFATAVSP